MTGRILIVESIATNRIMLCASLEAAHYTVDSCSNNIDAAQAMIDFKPDIVFLDLASDLESALAFIAIHAILPGSPPIVATLAFHDPTLRVAALEAGAADVVSKPISDNILQARIRSLLRARDVLAELQPKGSALAEMGFAEPPLSFMTPARVVVLTSRPGNMLAPLAGLVAKQPSRFEVHHTTADFAGADSEPSPDLFIIDGIGPNGDAMVAGQVLRLQSDLRSRSQLRHAAQILILPADAADLAAMALDMGADDLVSNRVTRDELGHRIDVLLRRKKQNDSLRANIQSGLEAAVTDPLTGLHNRRYALPHLANLAEAAAAQNTEFAIMILDIDHFKSINDTYGHRMGDIVLTQVGQGLKNKLRPDDMIARIGGEEFLVAMPRVGLEQARQMAERLRRAVESLCFDKTGQGVSEGKASRTDVRVTLSVGVAMGGADCRSEEGLSALFDRADEALYRAKSDGRNMVTLHSTAA